MNYAGQIVKNGVGQELTLGRGTSSDSKLFNCQKITVTVRFRSQNQSQHELTISFELK